MIGDSSSTSTSFSPDVNRLFRLPIVSLIFSMVEAEARKHLRLTSLSFKKEKDERQAE